MDRRSANVLTRRDLMRRAGLAAAGGWALGTVPALADGTAHSSSRKPNIVFILADDLGYGDVGCYGQKKIRTPTIDTLAVEGTRFTQFYAGSTVCAPSRCTLMTGYHTGHCHVRGNVLIPLRAEDSTVAEILKRAGYATGIIGKWGLGEPDTTGIPNRKGFDYFFGYLGHVHAHNSYPDYLWRNEEKVPLPNVVENGVASKCAVYSNDLFTKEALEFVERSKAKPFFLYLAYTVPHANNERGWRAGKDKAADQASAPRDALSRVTGNGLEVPSDEPYTNEPWPQVEKNYAAMITRMDRDIGQLVARLKSLGIDDNTIIFFTSDNGPHKEGGHDPTFFQSSGSFRGIKRDLTEGGIRVPMIVRWPGHVKAGGVSDQVWAFWDFMPTAAQIGGVELPQGIDGISMLPALLGQAQKNHDYLYWEFFEGGFRQAARMGDWKAIRKGLQGEVELYHLSDDPGETRDVASTNPAVISKAAEVLRKARTDSPEFPVERQQKKGATG